LENVAVCKQILPGSPDLTQLDNLNVFKKSLEEQTDKKLIKSFPKIILETKL